MHEKEYIDREALLESLGSLPSWMMKSNEPFTKSRRKTPCFSYGNIRRKGNIQ